MDNVILPVILCGGSGTRLWPLSRRQFPKQLALQHHGASLLDLALERSRLIAGADEVLCVTSEACRHAVAEAMETRGVAGDILLEPEPRNTAPALCCAALLAESRKQGSVLVAMPSDHHIADAAAFSENVS